jgi:hypothetical protein
VGLRCISLLGILGGRCRKRTWRWYGGHSRRSIAAMSRRKIRRAHIFADRTEALDAVGLSE